MLDISYWFWVGTINLFILCIIDIINNMEVDDRQNWTMMGVTFGMIFGMKIPLWHILAITVVVTMIIIPLVKLKIFGQGDTNAFMWLFFGYGIINMNYLISFLGFLMVSLSIIAITNKIVKINKMPLFPIILIVFWFNNFYHGLY